MKEIITSPKSRWSLIFFHAFFWQLLQLRTIRNRNDVSFISDQINKGRTVIYMLHWLRASIILYRCEIKEQSLNILLEVGPPMYLGFLIHVFLHFVIIQTKIGRQLLAELEDGYSSFGTVSTISEYFDAEDDPDLV